MERSSDISGWELLVPLLSASRFASARNLYLLGFLTKRVERAGLYSVRRWEICVKLELSPSPSPRSNMASLPRKRMLDQLFTIAFLLLALSSSSDDDMCAPAFLVVKVDASLYSFPVTLGSLMLGKKTAFFRVTSFPFI